MADAKKGLFVGESHSNGGIPSKVTETNQLIEIEGDEYYICREAYQSDKSFSFTQKTNKQVLDYIYTKFSCKLEQSSMNAGDFIICKVVVKDKSKHSRKGTVKQILNAMQSEKSCRVENDSPKMYKGGNISNLKIKEGRYADAEDIVVENDLFDYAEKKGASFDNSEGWEDEIDQLLKDTNYSAEKVINYYEHRGKKGEVNWNETYAIVTKKMAKGGEIKWRKNISEEFGWKDNPYDHKGGYVSEDGDYVIYQEGRWVKRNWGDTFVRDGSWTVDFKNEPINYGGSKDRINLDSLKDAKEFVNQINTTKMAKGGLTPEKAQIMLDDGIANKKPLTAKQKKYFKMVAKKSKGGSVDYSGNYYSSTDFVNSDYDNLMPIAKELFGEDWETGGDYDYDSEEIKMLLKKLGGGYKVIYVDSDRQNRENFEEAKRKYFPLMAENTNDGDIFVIPTNTYAEGGGVGSETFEDIQDNVKGLLTRLGYDYTTHNPSGFSWSYSFPAFDFIYNENNNTSIDLNSNEPLGTYYLSANIGRLKGSDRVGRLKFTDINDLENVLRDNFKPRLLESNTNDRISKLDSEIEDLLYQYGDSDEEMALAMETEQYKSAVKKHKQLVVEQSKSDYAEGGQLEKEFKFDKNFVIYVPSTTEVGKTISKAELEKRVKEVEKYVANTFGGYTETETEGGYKSTEGDIIEEDVVKVSVFAQNKDWKSNEKTVVNQVKKWATKWGQEAIGFEYEGNLYYIDEEGKFALGGFLSGVVVGGVGGAYLMNKSKKQPTKQPTKKSGTSNAPKYLVNHSGWLGHDDYKSMKAKGYTNKDIKEILDRDIKKGYTKEDGGGVDRHTNKQGFTSKGGKIIVYYWSDEDASELGESESFETEKEATLEAEKVFNDGDYPYIEIIAPSGYLIKSFGSTYAEGGKIRKEKVKKSHYKIYDKKSNKLLGEVEKGSGGIWFSYDEFGTPISKSDTELWLAITPFEIRASEGDKSYLEYVTTTNRRYKLYAEGGEIEDWKSFVLKNKSWFKSEDYDNKITLMTRNNSVCDDGDCSYGEKDLKEAEKIEKLILQKYPNTDIQIQADDFEEYVVIHLEYDNYAKGGVTEHGLQRGDTIVDDIFWKNKAKIKDKDGKTLIVDIDKGKRNVKYAKGGDVQTQFDSWLDENEYDYISHTTWGRGGKEYEHSDLVTKFKSEHPEHKSAHLYAKGGKVSGYFTGGLSFLNW